MIALSYHELAFSCCTLKILPVKSFIYKIFIKTIVENHINCISHLFPSYNSDSIVWVLYWSRWKKSRLYAPLHFFLLYAPLDFFLELLFILLVLPCVVQLCSVYSNTGSAENIRTPTLVIVWFPGNYEEHTTMKQLVLVLVIILCQ